MESLWKDLIAHLGYLPRSLFLAVPLLFTCLYIREYGRGMWRKLRNTQRLPWTIAFSLWAALILTTAVAARSSKEPLGSVWEHFGFVYKGRLNTQMVENVLVFVPYSFLFLAAFRPTKPFLSSLTVTACTTLLIELSQLTLRLGVFQVSDLVHNMEGGIIGALLWMAVCRSCPQRTGKK